MKRTNILLCIALMISLTGTLFACSSSRIQINTNQTAENYIENEDYQNYLNLYSNCAKTNDGYYFISNNRLYLFDNDSQNTTIACSKINCKHNDDKCSAYFSTFNFFPIQLSYYDNALYILGWELEGENIHQNYIYQISLDNYKRKKAVYIGNSNGLTNTVFLIHRGNVYYTMGSDIIKETTATLYRKQLGNTEKKNNGEIVFEYTGIGARIQDISAYANNIFVSVSSYANKEGDGYSISYNGINIHTLKIKNIFENNKFFSYADGEYVYYENDEKTVSRTDINTNKKMLFCNINGPCYISADSNYIYFDNLQSIYIGKTDEKDRKILVYDKNGNYITKILPKNPKDECYFGGDDIMIFKENGVGETITEDISTNSAKGYYVFDKSQLTSSNKQFIDME